MDTGDLRDQGGERTLHRGGEGTAAEADPGEQAMAVRSAQALGLEVAGVDLIRSARGPLVLEVNSTPGLEGVETTCQVDVAGAIIEHVAAPDHSGLWWTQKIIKPAWKLAADGCNPDRETADAIQRAGFSHVEIEPFRAPMPIANPHIAGKAIK